MHQTAMYPSSSFPIDRRLSSLSLAAPKQDPPPFGPTRYSQQYDPYQEFIYRSGQTRRRRLSSTGDGSADSSTTASGSSCGEGSEEAEREEERRREEGHVTEEERQQVETFFKGLKTQVYVCNSLANLYFKTPSDKDWQLRFTGIPVVVLDIGESRARDKRRIQIALAERGTCFMLWSDTIDNLSAYRVAGKAFHTMCCSSDHTKQAGFSFDASQAAEDMWTHIERLVSCPENISLSTPGKKKKKEKKAPKPQPLPPKSHISQPCCFQHITSVDRDDTSRYYSLKELLPSNVRNSRIDTLDDI